MRHKPHARRCRLLAVVAGMALLVLPCIAGAQTAAPSAPKPPATEASSITAPVHIEVNARAIPFFDPRDHSAHRFGALDYRSGLVLTSRFPGFGGLSALRLDARGERFIAVSDKGSWFTGRIQYQGRDMTGLADVEAAPLIGPDGRPITTRGWFDSEAIARDGDIAYVALERVNQVLRYDLAKGFTRARGEVVPLPPAARRLPYNKGIEALVVVPKDFAHKGLPLAGTLIALSERGLDDKGNLLAFLVDGPTPGQFSVHRTDGYDISDAVLLPSGNLLVLERKFSWLAGVGIRIRRVALRSIVPGALVDGPTIFEADLGHEIDNMEGIDAHVTDTGETVLTLISDDNFSPLQRTLLLQFTLVE